MPQRFGTRPKPWALPRASSSAKVISEVPISVGLKEAAKQPEPWRIATGPPMTATQFHCATVPDGPDCKWKGGKYERIEAENQRLLETHFGKLDSTAVDFCVVCGREDDLVDHKMTADGLTATLCCDCRDKRVCGATYSALQYLLADDLSIPEFLRRTP
jgi:hypothetical protein